MPPKKHTPPSPRPDEDFDALDEDMEDRSFGDLPSDPSDPNYFRAHLGATLFGNPRDANDRTKMPDNLATAPVVSAAGIEGAERWLVEARNHDTGQADYLGEMPLTATPAQVIKRFLDAMPTKDGQPSAEIYFKALDKTGTKIGTATKPDGMLVVPWHNPTLRELLKEKAAQNPPPSGSEMLVAFLQKQLDQEREDRKAERVAAEEAKKQAREMEQALLKQRLDHAANMQNDLGAAYSAVNATQKEGFTSLMTTSERMALEREKREEERLRREREEEDRRRLRERDSYEEERKRREEERKDERERLRAENLAALERVKAEADLRLKEAETRLRLEEAKIAAEVEKERARALAETERLRSEREREAQQRKDEQERRDKLDAAERERAREFAISMEKIRTDALAAAEKRMDGEAKRQEEHTRLMLGLIEKQSGAGGHKLGPLGEVLDMFGLTIPEVIEKAKGFIGGDSKSMGVAMIEGLGSVAQEFIKRLPPPDGYDDEDDDGEEEEEQQPTPRRRVAPPRRQIEEKAPEIPSAPIPALERALVNATPAEQEAENAIPLEDRKAGRQAVQALVDRLEDADPAKWGEAVMNGKDLDALVRYLGLVGLRRALEGYEIDPEAVGKVLVELGLFEEAPMEPKRGEG